jgi:hypothetical protein
MKRILALSLLILLWGCGVSEQCVTRSGTLMEREIETTPFEAIYVYPGVSLFIAEGSEYSVRIQAGENVIDDVEAKIIDNRLVLRQNSSCNWVRKYGVAKIYVTAPALSEIYSNTDREIRSVGVLNYPILRLYATDLFGGVGTGDFHMQVNTGQLVIASNNMSAFFISGNTQEMLLNFYDYMSRFEGANLAAKKVNIFQRSSNDMIIRPTESLTGDIYSTGNVILKTMPSVLEVTRHYRGRVVLDLD